MRFDDEYLCDVCGTPVQSRSLFCRRCGSAARHEAPPRRGPLMALATSLLLMAGFLTGILLPVQSGLFPFVVFGLVLASCALPALKHTGPAGGNARRRLLRALDVVRIRPMVLPPSEASRWRSPLGR